MTDVLPLFEEVDWQDKSQWGNLEWQSNAIISHRRSESLLGLKLRFPSSEDNPIHVWLREEKIQSKRAGTVDLNSMLHIRVLTGKGFFHIVCSSVPWTEHLLLVGTF